jgi:hypothetical protein
MSTTNVQCSFLLNTGEVVSMKGDGIDAALTEIKTSAVIQVGGGVAATSIGTYADGKSIVAVLQPLTPTTDGEVVLFGFISRRGAITAIIPTGGFETASEPWACGHQLQAGDTLQIMTAETGGTADDRVIYCLETAQGTQAIFSGTPSAVSGTSVELLHVLSGTGLGAAITGQRIMRHWAQCPAPSGLAGTQYNNSVFLVNDRGLPMGGSVIINPALLQPVRNMMGTATPMLNWQVQVTDI